MDFPEILEALIKKNQVALQQGHVVHGNSLYPLWPNESEIIVQPSGISADIQNSTHREIKIGQTRVARCMYCVGANGEADIATLERKAFYEG